MILRFHNAQRESARFLYGCEALAERCKRFGDIPLRTAPEDALKFWGVLWVGLGVHRMVTPEDALKFWGVLWGNDRSSGGSLAENTLKFWLYGRKK